MLFVIFGAAAAFALAGAFWRVRRLWTSLPRRNADLVLF